MAYEPAVQDIADRYQDIPDNCRVHIVQSADYKSWALRFRSLLLRRNNSLLSHADKHLSKPLRELSEKRQYDVVVVTHSFLGILLPILRKLQPHAKLVTDAHNFETSLTRQYALTQTSKIRKLYFLLSSHWNKKLEQHICERTDLLLATSELDATAFKALSPSNQHKVQVIPNFVDARAYEQPRIEDEDTDWEAPSIIFPATMFYFPNVNGAVFFGEKIYPHIKASIPGITWRIVGRGSNPQINEMADRDPSIVVTGYVPDVGAYMRSSSVVVVPLLEGGGTRLKILEAWAYGTPVVSTTKGAEGLDCKNGRDICLEDDPLAFADAVIRLIKDRNLSRQIVSSARTQLIKNYDREAVKNRLYLLFGEEKRAITIS